MRRHTYTCRECGHQSWAIGSVRDAAIDAMNHQLEVHDRLQWRHHVTGTATLDPVPEQPRLW